MTDQEQRLDSLRKLLRNQEEEEADKVFLIIPYNVEVSSEESEMLIEESLRSPLE